MSVRKAVLETDGIYFLTITNCAWLPLFERADGYGAVYQWFDNLKANGHFVLGYVIMPNHLHCIIAFRNTQGKSINTIVGNGKRFMAYELVRLLQQKGEHDLLAQMASHVNATDKKRGKLHEVFEPSFDCKPCFSISFIEQKLNYIHANPCRGKWKLAENVWDYKHSSAKYYYRGEHSCYEIKNFSEVLDIDLSGQR
jgi:REP element-mobilizing transposase RayT